jgi:hypothetical protein
VLQEYVVGVPSGPVALPPLRVHCGLGDRPSVDWLRIIWPDGVLQAELEVPGDRVMALEELQRKTSSCPLLFAWDGTRFEFVADFGGMTDAESKAIMKEFFQLRAERLKLLEKYSGKLDKHLPHTKVFQFVQVENKIAALLDVAAAASVPIVTKTPNNN